MAILVAAFVLGGHVVAVKAEEQPYLKAALQNLAEIHARAEEIRKAREYVGRCRADVDQCRPSIVERAPVPVAPMPVVKPPIVAAPVEKPKPVEQVKVQAPPVKPQQPPAVSLPTQTAKPAEAAQNGVKVYAMKVPLEKDTQIKGVLYKKGEPLWAVIRETKDGRIVDKDGKLASGPELAKAPPRNAILVPFKAPQL